MGVRTSEPHPEGTPAMSRTTSTDLQFFVRARNVGTCDWNSSASESFCARTYTAGDVSKERGRGEARMAYREGSAGCCTTQRDRVRI